MCGITGFLNVQQSPSAKENIIRDMVKAINHRGPDECGYYNSNNLTMGQSRLSIIDLSSGTQPIYNEDRSVVVTFNGEIYNYIELKEELSKKGHKFYTTSDTEVIPHLYDEYGLDFLAYLNGNFAISLWDTKINRLVLARDRVGIRPLFYSVQGNSLIYSSEMKSIFKFPGIEPKLDIIGLDQIFSLWANVPPRTVFEGISELPAGSMMIVENNEKKIRKYWEIEFPNEADYEDKGYDYYIKKTQEHLYDSTTIRLRADVPVASYLSGGIDSSIIASLVKKHHNNDLVTFSVAFNDSTYDERPYQKLMADYLGTDHRIVEASYDSISDAFDKVIEFAEKPTIRTAPAPLLILSQLVKDNDIKVVLTGEGADEVFGGYNIFKEDRIRRFWAKDPSSKLRPQLLSRIYPYIANSSGSFWQAFFKPGLEDTSNPFYSHLIRWKNTSAIKKFFHPDIQAQFNEEKNVFEPLREFINKDILKWAPLCRAQYLEMSIFMSGYLLSTQGDRMMMGNSIEGRFPFLDHRVIEFASTIPPKYKIKILNEKQILKDAFKDYVPQEIVKRAKQPYRAPISPCFLDPKRTNNATKSISQESLLKTNIFNTDRVELFKKRLSKMPAEKISARDDMTISGIVSTQLLHKNFIER